MTITKSQTPNEFLVRWSDAGQIQGAHIVFREAVIEDGVELSSRLLPAQPVALAGEVGFPLGDVLAEVQSSALATIEARDAALTQAQADLAAAQSALAASQAAQAELQAKLDALTGGVIDGVPQQVTAFQAKAALLDAGLLPQVESIMAQDSTPALAKLAWATAQVFNRSSPTVAAMASALGLTDAQIDALFVAGAAITA